MALHHSWSYLTFSESIGGPDRGERNLRKCGDDAEDIALGKTALLTKLEF